MDGFELARGGDRAGGDQPPGRARSGAAAAGPLRPARGGAAARHASAARRSCGSTPAACRWRPTSTWPRSPPTTPGLVGADLRNLVNEAALLAARRERERRDPRGLLRRDGEDRAGAERQLVLNPEDRRRVAYHESGHALVGLLVPEADPVQRVTIVPRGQALGVTYSLPDDDRYNYTEAVPAGAHPGRAGRARAEEIVFNVTSHRCRERHPAGDAAGPADGHALGHEPEGRAGHRWRPQDGSEFLGSAAARHRPRAQRGDRRRWWTSETQRIIDECYSRAHEILGARARPPGIAGRDAAGEGIARRGGDPPGRRPAAARRPRELPRWNGPPRQRIVARFSARMACDRPPGWRHLAVPASAVGPRLAAVACAALLWLGVSLVPAPADHGCADGRAGRGRRVGPAIHPPTRSPLRSTRWRQRRRCCAPAAGCPPRRWSRAWSCRSRQKRRCWPAARRVAASRGVRGAGRLARQPHPRGARRPGAARRSSACARCLAPRQASHAPSGRWSPRWCGPIRAGRRRCGGAASPTSMRWSST